MIWLRFDLLCRLSKAISLFSTSIKIQLKLQNDFLWNMYAMHHAVNFAFPYIESPIRDRNINKQRLLAECIRCLLTYWFIGVLWFMRLRIKIVANCIQLAFDKFPHNLFTVLCFNDLLHTYEAAGCGCS